MPPFTFGILFSSFRLGSPRLYKLQALDSIPPKSLAFKPISCPSAHCPGVAPIVSVKPCF